MDDSQDFVPRALFQNCVRLDPTSAVRANRSLQNFVVFGRTWYVDATLLCKRCEAEFLFSVAEQRHWYEELKFYVDSIPRLCPACRNQKEARKMYDAQIANALKSADKTVKHQVLELINRVDDHVSKLPDAIVLNKTRLEKQINALEDR